MTISELKLFVSHLTFIQLSTRLKHTEFDLDYVEVLLSEKSYGTHYTGDHFDLALVLMDSLYRSTQNILKSKILDFEILSHVHVYNIV